MEKSAKNQQASATPWADWGGLSLILIGLAALYVYFCNPNVAGFFYDDGMYLMAGQALAAGQGYRLMGMVGQPLFYKYPPLYPVLLALLIRLKPGFPLYLPLLKELNILLSLGALALVFHLARHGRQWPCWMAYGAVLMVGTHICWIESATELMSEPLFLLLSFSTIAWALRMSHTLPTGSRQGLPGLIALSIAAFYTRTMGIALILSVAIWLWSQRQQVAMRIYLAACFVLSLPWMLWSASKPNHTLAVGDFLVRSFQETYFESLKMDLRYEATLPTLLRQGIQTLMDNLAWQFWPSLAPEVLQKEPLAVQLGLLALSLLLLFSFTRIALQHCQRKTYTLTGIYLLLYCGMLTAWSFYAFYPRFLIVIFPLGLLLLLDQARRSPWLRQPWKSMLIALFMLSCLASNACKLAVYLPKPYPNTLALGTRYDLWNAYASLFQTIRHTTPTHAPLYTEIGDEAYFYSLYTGRPVLDLFIVMPPSQVEQRCPLTSATVYTCLQTINQERAQALYQQLKQNRVQYVVLSQVGVTKAPQHAMGLVRKQAPLLSVLIQQFPQEFIPIAQSPQGLITLFRFQPRQHQ